MTNIIKIIERRSPFSVLHIYSCYVQGDKCSSSICSRLVQIGKKEDVDAIIIATSSDVRLKIVSDILNKQMIRAKYWILEKVLAQSIFQLYKINNLCSFV